MKVKSCNAFKRMLLVSVRSYLKSVLIYKYLFLDTSDPDTIYYREQTCEEPWLFFEATRDPHAKILGKTRSMTNEFSGCEKKLL